MHFSAFPKNIARLHSFASATAGFSVDTDHQLLQAMEIEGCPEWKKCIVLLIDEMQVKTDLVYDKISGTFIIIDVCTVPLLFIVKSLFN